jgi:enoyl-CoA hydratase/carnithine racemase
MPLIESKLDGAVGTITLNNPKRRNALSNGLVEDIVGSLSRFASENARVVVLRAQSGACRG